jgi:hypothetical protein
MKEILELLYSLRIHTEESLRRQAGDPDPRFFWSGYGCCILRNRLRDAIERKLRFEDLK